MIVVELFQIGKVVVDDPFDKHLLKHLLFDLIGVPLLGFAGEMASVREYEKKVLLEMKTHRREHLFYLLEILVSSFPEAFTLVHQEAGADLSKIEDDIEEGGHLVNFGLGLITVVLE